MEKVPAVLEIAWAQVHYSLELVVYFDAEGFRHGGDAADDGSGFPWCLVYFW